MSEDKQDDDGKLNNTKQCGTLWSLLILVIPYTHISFILFSVVFLYRAPPLTCWTEQGNSSTTSEHHGATLECSSWERNGNLPAYVNSSLYVQNLNDTGNQSNNLERFCKDGWTFDTSEGNTLVSEFGLECTAAWKRPTLQSVYMIGSLFGSLFGGPITDRFGRKNTFTATFIINGCLHLPLSFTTSYVQYIVLLHFTGFLQIVLYLAGFVLAQELVPTAKRSIAALSVNVCHGLGYLILPLVAYFIRDWRWFLRFYTVACVCYFPILWFIPKSPKWVALHRSVSSKNEKMNAKEMETFIGTNNNQIEQVDSDKQLSSTMDLFKQPILRRRVLIVCLLWIVTTLGFYTLGLNSSNLGGNIYLNCVYGALVDITSYVTTALILSKKGRKSATSITIGIGGIMCLITPMLRRGETMNLSIPFYVTGCLSLLSAFMTIWLPETKATGLPNTLDEALELENYRTKISVRKLSASFRRKSEGTADTAG
uniref:solute carrier family 22 member 4-like isoform X3 n=1 Tax=Ciona intestinalis TaxID=7719 RepID=UPI000EF4A63A|nr:solute carrier family 22 member 4-like isoform X3 [Ciona intestinalis]|eukprot:XP_026694719.1 solute carrier family 22 member 4-like isoform X3 [Ciona intestinalis]